MKFIFGMGILAVLGFLLTLPAMIEMGYSTWSIIDRALNLVSITVPPALPAALTAGTVFALARLKKKKINCISPPRVNVAGRVNMMVFDKTGTLTEDGLQVLGFRGVEKAVIRNRERHIFGEFTNDCSTYQQLGPWWKGNRDEL